MQQRVNWNPLEILKEITTGALGAGIVEGVKGVATEKVKSAMTKKFADFRTEMWTFVTTDLYMRDPIAAENLRRRQSDRQEKQPRTYGNQTPYKAMEENKFADILASVYKTLEIKFPNDEQKREDERLEAFERMGRMNDQEFDQYIEGFNDDDLHQIFDRIICEAQALAERISRGARNISAAAPGVMDTANSAAGKAATGVNRLTGWIKNL